MEECDDEYLELSSGYNSKSETDDRSDDSHDEDNGAATSAVDPLTYVPTVPSSYGEQEEGSEDEEYHASDSEYVPDEVRAADGSDDNSDGNGETSMPSRHSARQLRAQPRNDYSRMCVALPSGISTDDEPP